MSAEAELSREEEIEALADETDMSEDEIGESIDTYVDEFNLPLEEAVRSIRAKSDASKTPVGVEQESPDEGSLADLTPDDWGTVCVHVAGAWEPTTGAIDMAYHFAQGGDHEDAVVKAIAWSKSELDRLEVGESYRVENLVMGENVPDEDEEWEREEYLSLNSNTSISEVEAVETPEGL